MKPRLRALLKARKEALKHLTPKSRDRLRHRVRVIEIAIVLRRRGIAS